MIQRVQTVYLFLALLSSLLGCFYFPIIEGPELSSLAMNDITYLISFVLSALLSLLAVFSYKDRKRQVVLGRLVVIINFVLFGLILYLYFTAYDTSSFTLGTGSFMPIASVILTSLANRAIMKDESLVRAAERFR